MGPKKQTRTLAAAVAAVAAVSVAAPGADAAAGFAFTRVAGDDRYETAAAAAMAQFGPTATDAILARGDDYPDALAGAYLAGAVGDTPILLTERDALPEATAGAIEDLGVERVYILGGTGAVSTAVEEELGEVEVERIQGNDRYATAAAVAQTAVEGATIGEVDGDRTAILATGQNFADALAAGPLASAGGFPILLTPTGSLSPSAAAALDALEIDHVLIAGGTAAVSPAVQSAVESDGRTSERLAGDDRYATAVEIADFAAATIDGWSTTAVDLASGTVFADALPGGAAAGAASRSLLLTSPTQLSAATEDYLEEHSDTLSSGRIYGGTAAVSNAVETAAETAATGTARADENEVVSVDTGADRYTYTSGGEAETVTYDAGDTYTVDGVTSTLANFEANITPGDRITQTATRHDLTNVAATAITNRTVGNVDTADGVFDFINDVTGDAVRSNVDYTGAAYTVDGATADEDGFAADLNEGDTVQITTSGDTTMFALTNRTVTGAASEITDNAPAPTATFKIGVLGDDPAASEDDDLDTSTTADTYYDASGGPGSTDVFAGEATTYAEFVEELTPGDTVAYTRNDGVETFRLTNRPTPAFEGDYVDGTLSTDSDPSPTASSGGSFDVVTATGPETCDYGSVPNTFFVDGVGTTETQFEEALTAGDDVSCREADPATGTSQRLELTNDQPSGTVGEVNTSDTPTIDPTALPPNSYEVLGRDGETVTAVMEYGDDTANDYYVGGSQVTLAAFEAALTTGDAIDISVDENTADDGTDDVTEHRLTNAG